MTNTTFAVGGDIEVRRLGFGAMRVTGPGTWGPPRDRAAVRGISAPAPARSHRSLPAPHPRPIRPLRRVDRCTRRPAKRGKDPARRRLQRHTRAARRRPNHHRHRNRAEPPQPHQRQLARHARRVRAARDRIHPLSPPMTARMNPRTLNPARQGPRGHPQELIGGHEGARSLLIADSERAWHTAALVDRADRLCAARNRATWTVRRAQSSQFWSVLRRRHWGRGRARGRSTTPVLATHDMGGPLRARTPLMGSIRAEGRRLR
jgi:hypothetical protein